MVENYLSLYLTFILFAFILYAIFNGLLFIKRTLNKQKYD